MSYITKEAKVFYGMIGMMSCAKTNRDYLIQPSVKAVHGNLKQELNRFFGRWDGFVADCVKSIPPHERDAFISEWVKRDYYVFSSVFQLMSDMSDEQRSVVEEFCTQLAEGKVNVVSE